MLAFLGLFVLIGPAWAVQPDEMLNDPALESRAREVGKELRCVVCQNQSIDDSDAELARDMRLLVRERIAAGDSNDAVRQYVVDRYGDYVLLKPPFKSSTLVLWLGPLAILGLAVLAAVSFYRRRKAEPAAAPLSADEKRRLDELLKDESR